MVKAAKTGQKAPKSAITHLQAVGDLKSIIPLNSGRNAYVRDLKTSANPNLSTDSPEFVAAVAANTAAGYGSRVRAELIDLAERFPSHGWAATRMTLEAAGALPVS
jgi:hypothetical protein